MFKINSLKKLIGRFYRFMKEKRIEIWFVLGAIFIPTGISLLTFTKPENYWLIISMVVFGFLSLIMAMVNIEIESFRDRKAKQIEFTIKQIEREKEDTKFTLIIKKLEEIIDNLKSNLKTP
jgi:hypothetical protein